MGQLTECLFRFCTTALPALVHSPARGSLSPRSGGCLKLPRKESVTAYELEIPNTMGMESLD